MLTKKNIQLFKLLRVIDYLRQGGVVFQQILNRMAHLYRPLILKNYYRARQGFAHFFLKNLPYYKLWLLLLVSMGVLVGYHLACQRFEARQADFQDWQYALQQDRAHLQQLEAKVQQRLAILTQYAAQVEANLIKVNALGEKLVGLAELNSGEFNFEAVSSVEVKNDDLLVRLNHLAMLLDKRYAQLATLQQAWQMRAYQRELTFEKGKPVQGWISSFFGKRHDPFTGQLAWHQGVDIAGKEGEPVKALASGIINFADKKGGYGNLVEINHGNGLMTRYAHNKSLLVSAGQLVRKDQAIALLGSSGHSSGPHVHLEVHKNGEPVDPGFYFPDLKRH